MIRIVPYIILTTLFLSGDQLMKSFAIGGVIAFFPNRSLTFLNGIQVSIATRIFLYWIGGFIFGFILWYLLYRFEVARSYQIAIFTLFIAGMVSNLADWTTRGYVVDYIPIWGRACNLADLYIATATALLLPALYFRFMKQERHIF